MKSNKMSDFDYFRIKWAGDVRNILYVSWVFKTLLKNVWTTILDVIIECGHLVVLMVL